MNAAAYDEILSDNPFFVQLKTEYESLYQHCITQSWVICVPRIGSLSTRVFSIEDICAHILVPNDELPETHFTTLTEKPATVVNKVITLNGNAGLPLQSHILFEESFYTEDYIKYKVWCIEMPLEPCTIKADKQVTYKENLISINDCIDLLWTQSAGRQVLEQIEQRVNTFKKKHPVLPTALGPLRDLVSELYTQCLQVAFQHKRLRDRVKNCKQLMENIRLAVETYLQQLLFSFIFSSICTCTAYEDARLNKTIRNLADITLRDLDVRKDIYANVPQARLILSKINTYSTVLEKIMCVKNALNAVSQVTSANKHLLTADDLLPVFVFLIIKSGLPNWYSQVTYIKEFRFSDANKGDADESAFIITTSEAVIEHIRSGALLGPPNPESYYYENDQPEENTQPLERNENFSDSMNGAGPSCESLEYVFELIKNGNHNKVKEILKKNEKERNEAIYETEATNGLSERIDDLLENISDDEGAELCHPLCYCEKCCRTVSKKMLRNSPTVSSRDSHGFTPLHIACIHGKSNIVDALISMQADINATDQNESTPLHYAASRGHQNSLLLLLHSGADVNKRNIDKNTPLHLAVNNGHMNCVNALIYFAEHARKSLEINSLNQNGDTPLHMASKWGYGGIAKLLIQNGAEPSLQNKKNKSAFDYAHNLRILEILKTSKPNLYEYIHLNDNVNEIDPVKSSLDINRNLVPDHFGESRSTDVQKSLENIRIIEKVLKAVSHGDTKLACFFLNIDYANYTDLKTNKDKNHYSPCHPLCECNICKKKATQPKGYEININIADSNGYTALHFAAKYGLNDLCEILFQNGADVNLTSKNGEIPLHLAAANNKSSTIRLLLNMNSKINARDGSGNTALHCASKLGNIAAVKLLLDYNPNINILNINDKTALDIAKEKVHLTIIDLLYQHTELSKCKSVNGSIC